MINDSRKQVQIEDMLSALDSLISCNTCFPPGDNYAGVADLLEALFSPLGCKTERVEVPEALWQAEGVSGPRVNLLLWPDLGAPDLPEAMIYFHIDTAAIGDGWTRAALKLTRENDLLFGRGAADMKGTVVAVRDALFRIQHSKRALRFRPVLAFCTDEEGGKYPGIRYLAETRELPAVLLNLNGSAEARIWAGCFGSLDVMLTCEGRGAHSGEPDNGVNAVEAALPVLNALKKLKAEVEGRKSTLPPPPWAAGPLHARLSVTAIHGGDKGSAIPGRCRITVNRRYMPEEDEGAVRAEIRDCITAALQGSPLIDWYLDEIGHLPPVTDPDGPATPRWTAARAAATGLPISEYQRFGSSTSSDFGWVQRAGVHHILLGGLSRPDRNVHGPDEFTTIKDLVELSLAIELFLSADFNPNTQSLTQVMGTTPPMETNT